jgi:hypothetical protein
MCRESEGNIEDEDASDDDEDEILQEINVFGFEVTEKRRRYFLGEDDFSDDSSTPSSLFDLPPHKMQAMHTSGMYI